MKLRVLLLSSVLVLSGSMVAGDGSGDVVITAARSGTEEAFEFVKQGELRPIISAMVFSAKQREDISSAYHNGLGDREIKAIEKSSQVFDKVLTAMAAQGQAKSSKMQAERALAEAAAKADAERVAAAKAGWFGWLTGKK